MFNLFGSKKLVVDAYTYKHSIFYTYNPKIAREYAPSYLKDMPAIIENPYNGVPMSTLRGCVGLRKLYSQGIILPLWTDVIVNIPESPKEGTNNPPGTPGVIVADLTTRIQSHPTEQWSNFVDPRLFVHTKLESPWLFYCKEEIDWIFAGCSWNQKDPLEAEILPGCLDFKYQHQTNVNILIKRNTTNSRLFMEAGTPIVHLIPVTERDIELKIHLVSEDEYMHMSASNAPTSFTNNYNKSRKIRQDNEKSKCPFHF